MSLFEPVKRLDSTWTSCTGPGRARARVDVDLRGAVGAHAEVRAHDRPRPAAQDLDQIVVVVAVRARQRIVQVGIADHDVVGGTADHVGVEDVVEEDVVDRRAPCPARGCRRGRAGSARTRRRATVMSRSSGSSCSATPVSSSARGSARPRNVTALESQTSAIAGSPRGLDAQVAHDDVLGAPDGDAREHRGRPPDEPDRRLGVRSKSCSGATRPAGSRIVPPLAGRA